MKFEGCLKFQEEMRISDLARLKEFLETKRGPDRIELKIRDDLVGLE